MKPSKLRYRQRQETVRNAVARAIKTDDHTNPYPPDTAEYRWFSGQLRSFLFWDETHKDMCAIYGVDPYTMKPLES